MQHPTIYGILTINIDGRLAPARYSAVNFEFQNVFYRLPIQYDLATGRVEDEGIVAALPRRSQLGGSSQCRDIERRKPSPCHTQHTKRRRSRQRYRQRAGRAGSFDDGCDATQQYGRIASPPTREATVVEEDGQEEREMGNEPSALQAP
jgi:hypothetical protein